MIKKKIYIKQTKYISLHQLHCEVVYSINYIWVLIADTQQLYFGKGTLRSLPENWLNVNQGSTVKFDAWKGKMT